MSQEPPVDTDDPVDLIIRNVPKHPWVTIIAMAVILIVSWLFFKPPLPEAATGTAGETLEGRVVEVLSDEEMPVAGQAQPVQRVLVEITRGS